MDRFGRVRVCGKGYENKNIILRKRRKGDLFLFLAALFGGTVYLAASVLFRALSARAVWVLF